MHCCDNISQQRTPSFQKERRIVFLKATHPRNYKREYLQKIRSEGAIQFDDVSVLDRCCFIRFCFVSSLLPGKSIIKSTCLRYDKNDRLCVWQNISIGIQDKPENTFRFGSSAQMIYQQRGINSKFFLSSFVTHTCSFESGNVFVGSM